MAKGKRFLKLSAGKRTRNTGLWGLVMTLCALGALLGGTSSSIADPLIIDMLMGEPVTMEEMIDDFAKVRVLYLGEVHSIVRHHDVHREIIQKLSEKGLNLVLGMEMFTHEQQGALDRWIGSKSDIGGLIRELGPEYWTNIRDYEKILLTARDRKVRLLGINAPDSLVKRVAKVGLDGLSPDERSQIPEATDQVNPQLDRLLRLRLRVHKAFEKRRLDSIVLAQAVRDATMARSISRFLETEEGKDAIVLVIAGSGHVNYGLGIPERVSRTHKLPYRVVIPTESGELRLTEQEKRQAMPVDISHEDLRFLQTPIADYLHVIPRKEEKQDNEPAQQKQPADDSLTMLMETQANRSAGHDQE